MKEKERVAESSSEREREEGAEKVDGSEHSYNKDDRGLNEWCCFCWVGSMRYRCTSTMYELVSWWVAGTVLCCVWTDVAGMNGPNPASAAAVQTYTIPDTTSEWILLIVVISSAYHQAELSRDFSYCNTTPYKKRPIKCSAVFLCCLYARTSSENGKN